MAHTVFRFYHDQLPGDEWRAFYRAVEAAVKACKSKMYYPCVLSRNVDDYHRVVTYVYNDHPEMFSFSYNFTRYAIGPLGVTVYLFYRDDRAALVRKSAELNRAISAVMAECFPEGTANLSDLHKEKKIFDWLTKKVVYDHESLAAKNKNRTLQSVNDAWTAYGALVLRKAVCQGIACAFKLLCDGLGLPSLQVIGMAGERHAWNIVRIGGQFYHVDCTWLLKSGINCKVPYERYKYLNITDEIIGANHKPEDNFLPKCVSLDANPYQIKGLCCRSLQELEKKALEYAAKGEGRFAFLYLSRFPTREEMHAVAVKVSRAVQSQVSYYWDIGRYVGFVIQRRQ